jgi:hypothetical protein
VLYDKITDVSEDRAVALFRVEEQPQPARKFDFEDGVSTFLRYVRKLLPGFTALHPRRWILFLLEFVFVMLGAVVWLSSVGCTSTVYPR